MNTHEFMVAVRYLAHKHGVYVSVEVTFSSKVRSYYLRTADHCWVMAAEIPITLAGFTTLDVVSHVKAILDKQAKALEGVNP